MSENIKFINLPPQRSLQPHLLLHFPSLYHFPEEYLSMVFGDTNNVPPHIMYVCPLCLINFIVATSDYVKATSDFTEDHVPPKSAGGTFKALTCKSCNNNAGVFESVLHEKINWEARNRGVTGIRIDVIFKATNLLGYYNGFVIGEEAGKWLIDFDPAVLKRASLLREWLKNENPTEQWEATMEVKHPDNKRTLKTLLKAAYLVCFTHWGYDFVVSASGKLIRDIIQGQADYPDEEPYFWFDNNNLPEGVVLPIGLCVIEKPANLIAFAVNIPLVLGTYNCIVSVLIPLFGQHGLDKIKEIIHYVKSNDKVDITFRQILLQLDNRPKHGYKLASENAYSL